MDETMVVDYTNMQAPTQSPIMGMFTGMWFLVWLVIAVLAIAGLWKVFSKAGKPGWAALIPIYNIWVLLEVVKKPVWWIILFFIPFVNFIMSLIVMIELAKVYGKSAVYGVVLLWLLSPIGLIVLGFSDAKYVGTSQNASQRA